LGDQKRVQIFLRDGFLADVESLGDQVLKDVALALIKNLSKGKLRGQPLENHPEIGDLSDCFKLYFDVRKDMSPGYRLVYRKLTSGEIEGVSIEAIAVGRRQAFEVYKVAIERLGRA
jgi:hypothetical protein